MKQTVLDSLVGKFIDSAKRTCEVERIAYEVAPVAGAAPSVTAVPDKVTLWVLPDGYVQSVEAWDPSSVEA